MASRRSFWELTERDRVLRSWYGDIQPARAAAGPIGPVVAGLQSYAWEVHAFPDQSPAALSREVSVVGVFGFPRRDDIPFAVGFAARPTDADAALAAAREALQMLAFMWGEPVPETCTTPAGTPTQHLDAYQVRGAHALVRRWLEEGHAQYRIGRAPAAVVSSSVRFVDLTPRWMAPGLHVSKCLSPAATPLVFGDSPFAAHLPRELRLHPIP
jgi:hypothetical protein